MSRLVLEISYTSNCKNESNYRIVINSDWKQRDRRVEEHIG